MRKNLLFAFLLMASAVMILTSCAQSDPSRTGTGVNQFQPQGKDIRSPGPQPPAGAGFSSSSDQKRFEVILEEGETKNLGGYTVLRDKQTGKEYLVITGLNGAPTVININ